MIDLHISGPGYGETIVLVWTDPSFTSGRVAAVVDICDRSGGEALCDFLVSQNVARIDFLAFTHPHADHITGAACFLDGCDRRKWLHTGSQLWWWGGYGMAMHVLYFRALLASSSITPESRLAAVQAFNLLETICRLQNQGFLNAREPAGRTTTFIAHAVGGQLRFESISPWISSMREYLSQLNEFYRKPASMTVPCLHRRANLMSLGLRVCYGTTQLLLGGDMEKQNWQDLIDDLHQNGQEDLLTSDIVKVSHHGSETGNFGNMWDETNGFFSHCKPASVITRWEVANRSLPLQHMYDKISRASGQFALTPRRPFESQAGLLAMYQHLPFITLNFSNDKGITFPVPD